VDAMRAVSVSETFQRRALLFQLLLESTLIVATPAPAAEPGTRTARPGESLNLVTLQDADGTVLPVFTSTAALAGVVP
jgi:type III secretion system (T3SS) SseB-like protein